MSTYEDASLIYYPSGYKESKAYSLKPTDGSGDLTFTRASTATRVNESGLIEGVRTNLILQSNTFNTTWTTSNASVTSGQAGYDGTNNAWLLSKSAANGYISQSPASSGSETISVYAKAGTDNWLHILIRDTSSGFFGGYWDLQNGVVGLAVGGTLKIESVGGGWYRCSASFVKSTSNYYRIYPAEGNFDTSGTSGNILIQSAQLEQSASATEYIPTTTTAVSVGMLANVPRIDYTGGGCGKLLLEPQRTNLIKNSNPTATESASNGITFQSFSWSIGFTNCVKWTNINNSYWYGGTVLPSTIYTISAYIIMDDLSQPNVGNGVGNDFYMVVGNATVTSYYYQNMGNNEWLVYGSITSSNINLNNSGIRKLSNSSKGFRATGFQVEAGSYPTSIITTSGTAVTRVADSASKSGISSLINGSEGVVFIDMAAFQDTATTREIIIGSYPNDYVRFGYVNFGSVIQFRYYSGGAIIFNNFYASTITNFNKIAFGWQSNNFVVYENGVKKLEQLSGATSAAAFNSIDTSTLTFQGKIQSFMIFPTRLSNAELATLTTL